MRIRFGMTLDGEHSWERHDSVNVMTVGPLGMLTVLETQLGLLAPRPSQAARVIQFRECLKASDNGRRFYSASFCADEIGTAATLLDWRDTLIMHGWAGTFTGSALPARLADIAAVEAAIAPSALAPGIGERLARVVHTLATRACHVEQLTVIEPRSVVPTRWQTVLDLFDVRYGEETVQDASAAREVPNGSGSPFLVQLQDALRSADSGTKPEWQHDGSVEVYCAETQITAAQWLAKFLADLQGQALVVNESGGALLDDTLAAFGAARAGLDDMSAFRPALQVLPLALQLLWQPLNVTALLAFLSLPIAPIPHGYRRRLAAAVAQSPGVNGPGWQEAMAAVAQACADNGHDFAALAADIKWWTQPATYLPQEGAPMAALLERASAAKAYFYRRLASGETQARDIHHAGFAQCAAFEAALDELVRQGVARLGPNQVETLLQQATSQGAYNPQRFRQVGCVLTARDPAAVCERIETVVWFWAVHPRMPARSPWTSREKAVLAGSGVNWPDQGALLAWQARTWLQPILKAGKRLVLVLPASSEATHPVWHAVRAATRSKSVDGRPAAAIPIQSIELVLANQLRDSGCELITHLALPALRRWWQLPQAIQQTGKPHSHTSLNLFINDPCQWVLKYPANLRSSQVLKITDDARLYGILAHRLAEKLAAGVNARALSAREIPQWFEVAFPALVREEGAVLLMPGRGADLARVKRTIRAAMVELARIIEANAPVKIDSEYAIEGHFAGGALQGSVDLLLHTANGETAIIDMKWGGEKNHRKALSNGTHLQLLLYAHMEHQQRRRWPGVAYFILESGRLVAAESGHFKDARGVRKPEQENAPMLWQRFLVNYGWRAEQLERGLVEATCAGLPTEDSRTPEDGMKLETMNLDWNDHKNLLGWDA